MSKEFNTQTKEQYGIAQFSRISTCGEGGGPVLFGADVQTNNLIRFTVSKNATMSDDQLMGRRYYPSHSIDDHIVEVYMTHAQFADLITNMNIGDGIPVTITRLHGQSLDPLTKDEVSNIIDAERTAIRNEVESVAAEAREALNELKEILAKPNIGKADRTEILKTYSRIVTNLENNIPFYIEKAGECIENLTTKAKVELGAAAQSALIQAGCAALGMQAQEANKLFIAQNNE